MTIAAQTASFVLDVTFAVLSAAKSSGDSAQEATSSASSIVQLLLSSRIDLATLMLFVGLGVWGAFTGAIRQISNLCGLAVGVFGAGSLATKMAPTVSEWTSAPVFLATVGCGLVGFFVLYGLSFIVFSMILKRVIPEGEGGMVNKTAGFLMGGAKALVIVFVILSALALIEPGVRAHWDRFSQEAKTSVAYRYARKNSLFSKITQFQTLQTIMLASGPSADPRALSAKAQLRDNPDLMALAKDERLAALSADPVIQKALFSGNYATLFANEKIRDLLNDRAFFDELGRVRGISLIEPPEEDADPEPVKAIETTREGEAHGRKRAQDIDDL